MRVGEPIWHCKATVDNTDGTVTFSAPKKYTTRLYYLTVMPASGYTATMEYGQNISNVWTIYATQRDFANVFHEGDVLYLDGVKPKGENGNGANAIITSVRPQNLMIKIVAETQDLNGKGMFRV